MNVTFIGIGAIGLPMALRIQAAHHAVTGVDVSDAIIAHAKSKGLDGCNNFAAAPRAEVVVVMVEDTVVVMVEVMDFPMVLPMVIWVVLPMVIWVVFPMVIWVVLPIIIVTDNRIQIHISLLTRMLMTK